MGLLKDKGFFAVDEGILCTCAKAVAGAVATMSEGKGRGVTGVTRRPGVAVRNNPPAVLHHRICFFSLWFGLRRRRIVSLGDREAEG